MGAIIVRVGNKELLDISEEVAIDGIVSVSNCMEDILGDTDEYILSL